MSNVHDFIVVFPARSETRTITCILPLGYVYDGMYSTDCAVRTTSDVTSRPLIDSEMLSGLTSTASEANVA